MKKWLSFALSLALICSVLSACVPIDDDAGTSDSSSSSVQTSMSFDTSSDTSASQSLETTEQSETTSSSYSCEGGIMTAKPVIYLYPEEETEVSVKLHYNGELYCTYPAYEDGWRVLARPDGTLQNLADGEEYSYLFWDGFADIEYDMSRGFCVSGEDTAEFLRETLSEMGMTPREYNEFIVYWLPLMQKNPYNLITFQGAAYTDNAVLDITPAPDSVLRVFMVFEALETPVQIEAPEIMPFERNGFTVVEWGGSEITEK